MDAITVTKIVLTYVVSAGTTHLPIDACFEAVARFAAHAAPLESAECRFVDDAGEQVASLKLTADRQ